MQVKRARSAVEYVITLTKQEASQLQDVLYAAGLYFDSGHTVKLLSGSGTRIEVAAIRYALYNAIVKASADDEELK